VEQKIQKSEICRCGMRAKGCGMWDEGKALQTYSKLTTKIATTIPVIAFLTGMIVAISLFILLKA
jgi:hypothetical protein